MSLRVLIADDHPDIVDVLTHGLTAAGLEVIGTAPDGAHALHQAIELKPDAVLLDMRMPVLDGLEAGRAILAALPQVRVIVFTGLQDTALVEDLEAAGIVYLLKGAPLSTIVAAITSQ